MVWDFPDPLLKRDGKLMLFFSLLLMHKLPVESVIFFATRVSLHQRAIQNDIGFRD